MGRVAGSGTRRRESAERARARTGGRGGPRGRGTRRWWSPRDRPRPRSRRARRAPSRAGHRGGPTGLATGATRRGSPSSRSCEQSQRTSGEIGVRQRARRVRLHEEQREGITGAAAVARRGDQRAARSRVLSPQGDPVQHVLDRRAAEGRRPEREVAGVDRGSAPSSRRGGRAAARRETASPGRRRGRRLRRPSVPPPGVAM